jgi:hypothetical protein
MPTNGHLPQMKMTWGTKGKTGDYSLLVKH